MTDVELEKKAKLYADEHYDDTDEYGYWFSDIEMLRRAYIAGAKEMQKENELLIIENEEMKKSLGCDTCQIHLEYANLNIKIRELESKENRVIWHDLKKNPNDLPQKIEDYIVALDFQTGTFKTSLLEYNIDEAEDYVKLGWFDSEYTRYDNVIAWCELPRFKKELAE